jgi:recombination protein RecR|tara:strand:+ start:255 stop:872 length:618 start_codon:yes stop_codon:yes gene_type:complete
MEYNSQKRENFLIQELIDSFNRFPGIGPKSAQRLAYFTINQRAEEINKFANILLSVKDQVGLCPICQDFTVNDICKCKNQDLNHKIICVVEDPMDILAIESARVYDGQFHVLHGVISPNQGIGPDDLKIKQLISRISDTPNVVEEIIIATNPNLEGEATAMYISKLIEPFKIKITRLARGLPSGGDIEYADGVTIGKAIEFRQTM